jgi:hypothetical protein
MLFIGSAVCISFVYYGSGYTYLEEFRLIYFDKIYESSFLLKAFGYLLYILYLTIGWIVYLTPCLVAFVMIVLSGIFLRLLNKNRSTALLSCFGTNAMFNLLIFFALPRLTEEFLFKLEYPIWIFVLLLVVELLILPTICIIQPKKIKSSKCFKRIKRFILLSIVNIIHKIETINFSNLKNRLKQLKKMKTFVLKIELNQLIDYLNRKLCIEDSYYILEKENLTKETVTLVEFLINEQEYVSYDWLKILSGLPDDQLTYIIEEILNLEIVKGLIINQKNWD